MSMRERARLPRADFLTNLLAIKRGGEQTVPASSPVVCSRRKERTVTVQRLVGVAVLLGFVCVTALAQGNDPLVGTWKLNAGKSTGPYTSGTSVFEAAGDGIKGTVDLVGKDGTAYHWTFTAKYDGKDYPVTGNNPFGDTIAVTRVDPNTVKISAKKDGKEIVTQTIVIAADGKTRTTTTKGKDAKGQPIEGMSFYEKQ
jgi:hypothetical protein